MNDETIVTNKTLPVNQNVQPSGVSHGFDTGYAVAYGVDEAIMIRNLQFFITANANRGHNFRDGKFWTYDRLEDFPSHFPYWTIKQIRRILASLVEQEVIVKGEFNSSWSNRTQWYAFKDQDKFIRNIRVPKTPLPTDPDLPKWATDSLPNGQLTDVEMGNCIYDTSTITSSVSSSTSLEVSKEVAIAPRVEVENSSSPKRKKATSEFSPKVREVSNQMVNLLVKHNSVYRPPADLSKFLYQVSQMLEVDKQDPTVLLKTFEWAVSDNEQRGDFNGWQGIIATNNKGGKSTTPAEIFRKHFSKIHSQMNSRPKRKFASGTDMNAAMEAMEDMNKRAL